MGPQDHRLSLLSGTTNKRSKADELFRAQGTFLRRGTLHVGWELTCGGPYDHHPV
jgi:hypothetical protein